MGNAILFYLIILKSYFINYTIPFYDTPNIPKLYSFTILLKYFFLILVRLQRWRERDKRPCEASCSLFASPLATIATAATNTPNPLPPLTQPPQQLHQSPKKSTKIMAYLAPPFEIQIEIKKLDHRVVVVLSGETKTMASW